MKLENLCLLIKNSWKIHEDDIFNLREDSPEWCRLKKNYERIVI
jgi:hypothetical protein